MQVSWNAHIDPSDCCVLALADRVYEFGGPMLSAISEDLGRLEEFFYCDGDGVPKEELQGASGEIWNILALAELSSVRPINTSATCRRPCLRRPAMCFWALVLAM